jgi:hypothetical protein
MHSIFFLTLVLLGIPLTFQSLNQLYPIIAAIDSTK